MSSFTENFNWNAYEKWLSDLGEEEEEHEWFEMRTLVSRQFKLSNAEAGKVITISLDLGLIEDCYDESRLIHQSFLRIPPC